MITLRNRTGAASKIGYLAKAVGGDGFGYASVGDVPIGVIIDSVKKDELCQIQTTGMAQIYIGKHVLANKLVRVPFATDGVQAGSAVPVGSEESYVSVGRTLNAGKGLVSVAINILISVETSPAGGGTVTSVSQGAGMFFTTITTAGAVAMGTPSNVSTSSANSAAGTTHSHALDLTSLDARYYTQTAADGLFITDAASDGTGYIRSNAGWVSSALVLDYSGGAGLQYDQVEYGEALSFSSGGGGIGISFTSVDVGGVITKIFEITHTPAGNYYDGWYPTADSGDTPVLVGSALTVDFAGGAYIDTVYNFITPNHEVTFAVDYAQMRTDGIFYSAADVDGLIGGFISDAASDGNIYGRVNGAWQNAGLVISYAGGTATDQINYGETLEFLSAGTGLGVSYNATTNEVTYTFTPTGSYYSGWLIEADAGTAKTNVTQAGEVDFAGGTYINTNFAFTAGSPPQYDITIDIDTAALNTLYDARYYTQTIIDAANYISGDAPTGGEHYSRVNGSWTLSQLHILYAGGTAHDYINLGSESMIFAASGTGLSVNYTPASNTVTYTYTPTGSSYSGWFIEGDAGTAKTNVVQTGEVDFIGGTNINTSFLFTAASPPQYDLTINLDATISLTSVTTTTGTYTNNIYERTAAAGVNIDGVVLKDGTIDLGTSTSNTIFFNSTSGLGDANFRLFMEAGTSPAASGDTIARIGLRYNTGDLYNAGIEFRRGSGTTGGYLGFTAITGTQYAKIDQYGVHSEGATYKTRIGSETIEFTRGSTNYIRATTASGAVTFTTNGRTGAYTESMLYVGTTYVDLKWGTGATTALKLRTDTSGILVTGGVYATGEVESYDTSDIRLKEILGYIEEDSNRMLDLSTIRYRHKEKDTVGIGLIAQEVQEIYPEAVKENDKGYLMVHYGKLVSPLLALVKGQDKRIKELERKLAKY